MIDAIEAPALMGRRNVSLPCGGRRSGDQQLPQADQNATVRDPRTASLWVGKAAEC
jgi:hypothetical protein